MTAFLIRNRHTGVVCGVTEEMHRYYTGLPDFEPFTIPAPVAAPPPARPKKKPQRRTKTE